MTRFAALLQRALRLNRDNPALWAEYARVELLYLAKIKERRRILGAAPAEPQVAEGIQVPDLHEEAGLDDVIPLAQVRAACRLRAERH